MNRPYLLHVVLDPCTYCGRAATGLDAIVPESRGGSHHWTNLTAVCASCNSSKKDSSLLGYLLWKVERPRLLRAQEVVRYAGVLRRIGVA